MNNFEFISYTPTPTDQFMLGVAKVKAYGKLELRFKHVKTKDGSGTFFCCANYTTQDSSGEKKYIPCFLLDSRSDEEMLMELIRDGVNQVMAQRSVHAMQPSASEPIHYPHGMGQNTKINPEFTMQAPKSMDEVAANDQLPF
jgi:hypothetical protein